jgi:hypothetical protein
MWPKLFVANPDDLDVGRSVVASGDVFNASSLPSKQLSYYALVVGVKVCSFELPIRVAEASDDLECGGVSELTTQSCCCRAR